MLSTMNRPVTVFGWSPSGRRDSTRTAGSEFHSAQASDSPHYLVPASVWESDENVYAELDLPGFAVEELDITLEKGVLRISGHRNRPDSCGDLQLDERRFGSFERSFRLSDTVDVDSVDAEYRNGVLCLKLTKRPEAQPMRVPIRGA